MRDTKTTIRPARPGDEGGMGRVHIDSWRTTYRGLLPQAYLDGLAYGQREEMWRRALEAPGLGSTRHILVGERGSTLVGFASAGPAREAPPGRGAATGSASGSGGASATEPAAELYAIYLLAEYHGQGIGARLFLSAAEQLRLHGASRMFLWVLDSNPTIGFYQRMGGRVVGQKIATVAGAEVTELAYAWNDLSALGTGTESGPTRAVVGPEPEADATRSAVGSE